MIMEETTTTGQYNDDRCKHKPTLEEWIRERINGNKHKQRMKIRKLTMNVNK